jgi:hypothetical protein
MAVSELSLTLAFLAASELTMSLAFLAVSEKNYLGIASLAASVLKGTVAPVWLKVVWLERAKLGEEPLMGLDFSVISPISR